MQNSDDALVQTRTTLINRLKNWQDQSSWQAFFDTYWRLIYSVAMKSGLTGTEAMDVVQETMFAVAKKMPGFTYDRRIGSFKSWLMRLTNWRIKDQFRKRSPVSRATRYFAEKFTTSDDFELDSIPSDLSPNFETGWDEEWRKALLEAATAKVKRHLDPTHFQIFDFSVNKEWPPDRIAKTFSVSVGNIYLIKHRVTEAIKEEVEKLGTTVT